MAFDEGTKSAAMRLGSALGSLPFFQSVGIGNERGRPILIVYVRRASRKGDGIPSIWEGLPVHKEYREAQYLADECAAG